MKILFLPPAAHPPCLKTLLISNSELWARWYTLLSLKRGDFSYYPSLFSNHFNIVRFVFRLPLTKNYWQGWRYPAWRNLFPASVWSSIIITDETFAVTISIDILHTAHILLEWFLEFRTTFVNIFACAIKV